MGWKNFWYVLFRIQCRKSSFPCGEVPHSYVQAFIKGSVLGITVFGVYDILVFQQWADRVDRSPDVPGSKDKTGAAATGSQRMVLMQASVRPTLDAAPLLVHFGAGFLAGLIESAILDMWEVASYWLHHRQHTVKGSWGHIKNVVNIQLVFRRAIYHSVGYATLFGTYELVRGFLVRNALLKYLSSGTPAVQRPERPGALSTSPQQRQRRL